MCFSATASFIVSGALLVAGTAAVRYTKSSAQVPFAVIPFVFAVQQFCEGMLWRTIPRTTDASCQQAFSYAFLIFAQIVWPLWVPVSIWFLEKEGKRKKMLYVLSGIGIVTAAVQAYFLFSYPVKTTVENGHIDYAIVLPGTRSYFYGLFYFVVTVIPPFISSAKRMKILGTLIFVAFLISQFFFRDYVISVWCFFAAAISVVVVWIVRELRIAAT
jgi:hypothetical protein